MHIKTSFYNFYEQHKYLNIQELIEFYSVFGDLDAHAIAPDNGIIENIFEIYIKNYEFIKPHFIYINDVVLQEDIDFCLCKIAKSDRKRFCIYKKNKISNTKGRHIYKILFEKNIINFEQSFEKPIRKNGQKNIKKKLRGYQIEDKIHFSHQSARFWFTFIAPHVHLIHNKQYEKLLNIIKINLQKYISLTFEQLSIELIKQILPKNTITQCGSFWTKKSEIDLHVKTNIGINILGEVKYKNTKICKNVLNNLYKKAQMLNLTPTHFALFSKSGFSKELLNIKSKSLMLYDLSDFKRLLTC